MSGRRRKGMNGVYSNLARARRVKKDASKRLKAEYLATLPKHPIKRLLVRLHPKRVLNYWFSKKGALMVLKITGIIALLIVLTIGALFAYFRKDLDAIRPEELSKRVHTTVTRYYDQRGPEGGQKALLWEDKGDGDYKLVVDGDKISDYMKHATVAIEDRDFYNHAGISIPGIIRAVINNYSGGDTQGGSTLTQQLVKQVFFVDEAQQRGLAGIPRKIKEIILSVEVERMYNKEQILNLYLNESPYGGRRNGVQSAAKTYFGIDANELNIEQSALLAAIPNQPGLYDPYNIIGREQLITRQHKVLDVMAELKYITNEQADSAKKVAILDTILPQGSQFEDIKAPHFVQMVRAQLETELGKATVGRGGLTVTTSLDLRIQKQLEASFKTMFNEVNPRYGQKIPDYAGFRNGAAMVQDTKTGQIVAMMGSRGYNYPNFGQDNAVTAFIQPGSTIKPLVYAKLFSKSKNPLLNVYGSGTVLADKRTTFDGSYTPNNADRKFLGNISIRSSLALSRNIPAITAMSITGVESSLEFMRETGDEFYCTQGPDAQVGLAAAIGGCGTRLIDHVNAFSTLARSGTYKPYSSILEVKNNDGETLKKWKDPEAKRIINKEVAYILADILADDNARAGLYGTNFPGLVVDGGRVKTASKTGTSDVDGKSKDIWMMSYSPALTMGVWLGNPDTSPLLNGNSSLPGPIIDRVMTYAHQNVYKKDGRWKVGDWYKRPLGLQTIRGELYPSWYDQSNAQKSTKLAFDKVSKKKATDCTPSGARIELSVLKSIDPETKKPTYLAPSGYNAEKDDDAHKCGDAKPSSSIVINLTGVDTYEIEVSVSKGKGKLTKLTISVDGKTINAQSLSGGGTYTATYTTPDSDPFTVKATVEDDLYYVSSTNQDSP